MSATDHWQSLKPETRMEMEKHARQLVRGSIIEDAAARFMAMCMAEAIGESKRRADLAPAAPKVKALVEALRWYASQEAWTIDQVEGPHGDYGAKARAALAALEGGDA